VESSQPTKTALQLHQLLISDNYQFPDYPMSSVSLMQQAVAHRIQFHAVTHQGMDQFALAFDSAVLLHHSPPQKEIHGDNQHEKKAQHQRLRLMIGDMEGN
jgi:hypothetical protein